jgi:hypothetical protein
MKITFYRFQENHSFFLFFKELFEVVDVPARPDIFVNCEEHGDCG